MVSASDRELAADEFVAFMLQFGPLHTLPDKIKGARPRPSPLRFPVSSA
jgi:hypothetical protein